MACRVRRLEQQAKAAHEHDRNKNEYNRALGQAGYYAARNETRRAEGPAGAYVAHNSRRRTATAARTEAVNKKLVAFLVEEARQGDEAYAVRAEARANGDPSPDRARLGPVASFASVTPGLTAGAALLGRRPFYFCALSLDVFHNAAAFAALLAVLRSLPPAMKTVHHGLTHYNAVAPTRGQAVEHRSGKLDAERRSQLQQTDREVFRTREGLVGPMEQRLNGFTPVIGIATGGFGEQSKSLDNLLKNFAGMGAET
ncbi:hypothetical protein T492DRAFT_863642, partial [Pavlovales sp. CCMP2436]